MISLFTELSHKTAENMLADINERAKKKDVYKMYAEIYTAGYVVYIAKNSEGKGIFNILKDDGGLPENMSVNWRSLSFLKQELKEL